MKVVSNDRPIACPKHFEQYLFLRELGLKKALKFELFKKVKTKVLIFEISEVNFMHPFCHILIPNTSYVKKKKISQGYPQQKNCKKPRSKFPPPPLPCPTPSFLIWLTFIYRSKSDFISVYCLSKKFCSFSLAMLGKMDKTSWTHSICIVQCARECYSLIIMSTMKIIALSSTDAVSLCLIIIGIYYDILHLYIYVCLMQKCLCARCKVFIFWLKYACFFLPPR